MKTEVYGLMKLECTPRVACSLVNAYMIYLYTVGTIYLDTVCERFIYFFCCSSMKNFDRTANEEEDKDNSSK